VPESAEKSAMDFPYGNDYVIVFHLLRERWRSGMVAPLPAGKSGNNSALKNVASEDEARKNEAAMCPMHMGFSKSRR